MELIIVLSVLFFVVLTYVDLIQIRNMIGSLDEFQTRSSVKSRIGQLNSSVDRESDFPCIYVFIPVLREREAMIQDCLQYFAGMNYPPDKTRIILVTSEKEIHGLGIVNRRKTTIDFVESAIRKQDGELGVEMFRRVHYPKIQGDKADQLNHAIYVLSITFPSEDVFLATYDVDSRPDRETLRRVAERYLESNRNASAFQQYSIYLKNYSSLSPIMKCSAIYQTLWTFIYELPTASGQLDRLTRNQVSNQPHLARIMGCLKQRLVYCVGHGHFIKSSVLQAVGLYPTNMLAEDLLLGYRLSLRSIPIEPIWAFDVVDSPASMMDLIKQAARWFGGETNIRHIYREAKSANPSLSGCMTFAYIARLYGIGCWLLGPMVFTFFILVTTSAKAYALTTLGLVLGLLYSGAKFAVFFAMAHRMDALTKSDFKPKFGESILVIALSPLRCLFNCLGPIYFVANKLWLLRSKREYEFERTEK